MRYFDIAISIAVFAALLMWGSLSNWIQYRDVCDHGTCMFQIGESWTAVTTAIFYQTHGARYWYLQLLSLNSGEMGWGSGMYQPNWPDGRFMIYTHNPNIGGFVVYATTLLGFQTIAAPAILTAAAYSLGIYLAFRFGRALGVDAVLGSVYGFLMATEFFYNLSWGLNLIRGWSWLGIFGLWWGVVRMADGDGRRAVPLLAAGALVTFLVGLDLFILVVSCAVCLALCVGTCWQSRLRTVAMIVGVAGGLLVLRQLQIIGALGVDVWATDILYTAGLKMPAELRWYDIPDEGAIAEWYDAHQLTRGHSSVFSITKIVNMIFFWAIVDTWKHMLLGLPVYAVGIVSTIVLAVARLPIEARALGGLVIGTSAAGFVLFPHFTGYFVKLGFPFLSPIIFLALAICVSAIWHLCRRTNRHLAVVVLAGLLVLWGAEQVVGFRAAAPEVYPHPVRVVPYGFWFCPPVGRPYPIACS